MGSALLWAAPAFGFDARQEERLRPICEYKRNISILRH